MRVAAPNFQTVRLSKGKHRSPEEGVCVIELASMLRGRRFSDREPCVDPAIGAFLWGYHDHLSDELRQNLYGCAAQVLHTRGDDELAARRAEMCRTWARQARSLRPRRLVLLRGVYMHVFATVSAPRERRPRRLRARRGLRRQHGPPRPRLAHLDARLHRHAVSGGLREATERTRDVATPRPGDGVAGRIWIRGCSREGSGVTHSPSPGILPHVELEPLSALLRRLRRGVSHHY